MIKQLAADKKMCIIVSSHDINHVSEVSSRILLMEKGSIIKDMPGGDAAYEAMVEYFRVKTPSVSLSAVQQSPDNS